MKVLKRFRKDLFHLEVNLKNIELFIERKKSAQIFGSRTWCTKKPFSYRVIHQDTV